MQKFVFPAIAAAAAFVSMAAEPFLESGRLAFGVNYWSSADATKMWRNWRPDEIEKDLDLLEKAGITILRVYPTWNDFQPIVEIHANCSNWNKSYDTRMTSDEVIRPETPAGDAGVDEKMMERFESFCDMAGRHGMKLIVAPLTGHMTFRLFLPPAFENRNLYADPYALKWTTRYLEYFVKRLRHHPAIAAWAAGNECHGMGVAESAEQAEAWSRLVYSTIRLADPSRAVIGFNGFELVSGSWRVDISARFGDYVPHHLYALWGRDCPAPFNSIRNTLFPAVCTKALGDVAGKPSFLEEHGVRRAEQASRDRVARYMHAALWNMKAADTMAVVWWCAFDQDVFDIAPYDWSHPCQELGLWKADRTPHPAAGAYAAFAKFEKSLDMPPLPRPKADAVFLVRDEPLAHACSVLARQAGIWPEFQSVEKPLKDASVYFLPVASERAGLTGRQWKALADKVREGATLYLSWHETFLPDIPGIAGVELDHRETCPVRSVCNVRIPGHEPFEYTLASDMKRVFNPCGAEVLGRDAEGNPVFFRNRYGKGLVYLLGFPLESMVHARADGYQTNAFEFYRAVCPVPQLFEDGARDVTTSIHRESDAKAYAIVVNNSEEDYSGRPKVAGGWRVVSSASDEGADRASWKDGELRLGSNAGIILTLQRQ